MHVKLGGELIYLWRAVHHEGEILESYITRIRDKEEALTFMKKALKYQGSPEKDHHRRVALEQGSDARARQQMPAPALLVARGTDVDQLQGQLSDIMLSLGLSPLRYVGLFGGCDQILLSFE